MTEIRFYHMERSQLENTLPMLLTKALERNHRILIKTPNPQQSKKLNDWLWTFDANSFLPHGMAADDFAQEQPILISDSENDNTPNAADVLILTEGQVADNLKDFALVCEMLDGRDPSQVEAARTRWKSYKNQEFEVTYWQQSAEGRWEKKA